MKYVRSKGEGECQGNSVHLYDVILLFQSAQGERGCLKISKFERTYFMDGLLCFWKYSALTFLLKLATQFLCFLCNFISSGYISGEIFARFFKADRFIIAFLSSFCDKRFMIFSNHFRFEMSVFV